MYAGVFPVMTLLEMQSALVPQLTTGCRDPALLLTTVWIKAIGLVQSTGMLKVSIMFCESI